MNHHEPQLVIPQALADCGLTGLAHLGSRFHSAIVAIGPGVAAVDKTHILLGFGSLRWVQNVADSNNSSYITVT